MVGGMEIEYTPNVKFFLKKLENKLHDRTSQAIFLLSIYGHTLRLPLSKSLGQGLFELRITGANHIRIFYCFHNEKIYLLHIVKKKQNNISNRDIDRARKIMVIIADL